MTQAPESVVTPPVECAGQYEISKPALVTIQDATKGAAVIVCEHLSNGMCDNRTPSLEARKPCKIYAPQQGLAGYMPALGKSVEDLLRGK
ncbi:hypothetical protein COV82_05375 [Candidatus Peregrinibacteria bacterium CG11_big_fil_rev_8_21_14_0_20_46_8]|nr:MAG: hypothetical protein COV82_05375 [Candidatus Peregrinibacteria bacterium CG11_big_fil_rev_8_21_14_0_20_46_8]